MFAHALPRRPGSDGDQPFAHNFRRPWADAIHCAQRFRGEWRGVPLHRADARTRERRGAI